MENCNAEEQFCGTLFSFKVVLQQCSQRASIIGWSRAIPVTLMSVLSQDHPMSNAWLWVPNQVLGRSGCKNLSVG